MHLSIEIEVHTSPEVAPSVDDVASIGRTNSSYFDPASIWRFVLSRDRRACSRNRVQEPRAPDGLMARPSTFREVHGRPHER